MLDVDIFLRHRKYPVNQLYFEFWRSLKTYYYHIVHFCYRQVYVNGTFEFILGPSIIGKILFYYNDKNYSRTLFSLKLCDLNIARKQYQKKKNKKHQQFIVHFLIKSNNFNFIKVLILACSELFSYSSSSLKHFP